MGEVIAFPKRAPAPEWIADVDAALSLSLDGWNKGFGWRPLPAEKLVSGSGVRGATTRR